ncbi:Matrix-remodeling-associated protein 5 [Dissostichus eleginoides]|uniref:Matrix-remodeling-associated protein 5 n=1 Tax=Dissostichus eleginoides TaxID=100907 RepID=A0AAD9CMF7_DISEL|nr:Matrix-remodeling-associated protein 5 [Dissostichus eleginoides]
MAQWGCANIFCRAAAAWLPLLFSSLLWQTISPIHANPPCPRSCSCPGVKEVHCTFRHLTTIPKTFPRDTERLNLGYNSLTEVEGSEFRSLRQLEMLMLHGNDISTVNPGAFYSLRSLQIMKLSYNKLTSVSPGLFEGLVSLIRLHLDHNLIDFIEPYSFSGLTSLKLLQLEGNLLKEIHPQTFITVSILGSFWTSGLKHLHLSDNLLEQLPAEALKTAPRLELLSLHGNPWTCDCQLQWLVEWSSTHDGVLKCKKERGTSEICPQCSSPQPLNETSLLELTPDKLTCERPDLRSALKKWDNPVWAESEAEPDIPYIRDFEKPLGHLTFVLSDSHGNSAHVACNVRHPGDSSPMSWTVNPQLPGELSVNVSLVTVLECEIDREMLQDLWQLVAYYYESPAILERELNGYLVAEPSWLLQPRVTLRLNRQQTTTKKLVMDFTTVITKNINSHRGSIDENDLAVSWALIRRGTGGRVKTALEEQTGRNANFYFQDTLKQRQTYGRTRGDHFRIQGKVQGHTLCQHNDPGFSPILGLTSPLLRNRYRQAQLDRIIQLGRMVTPKPRTSYHNYKQQPLNPAKSSSSSFYGFSPTPRSYNPTTPGVLYGGQWPVGAGLFNSRRPTAAPPFPWILGAGSGGLKPRITTVTTASMSVLAESDVFLSCKATGNPEPNIAWTKVSTGATIPANTKHGPRFEVFKNGTFVIKNIQLQDRGQYLCTAQNSFGSDRMVITLAVQTEAPKIRQPASTEIAVYLGKNVNLDCFASGKPPAQISWILPDRTKGDYKCIASNAAGADTITYHLHVAALPPSISEGGMDTVIIQPGRSVYVHCTVKGEPVPTLKWMLPAGVHVKPTQYLGRRLFVFPNGTLYVKNVSPADAGSYECLATNAVGIAKRVIQLEHSVSAMYGSAVYLHCPESTGSTRGTYWQLPSKTIVEHRYSPERPIKVFRNGTLRILQLTELDGGNYLCVFPRPNGEDMELFQVEVIMTPPKIEHVRTAQTRVTFGENFQVDCVATGLPDPEVTWSLPDGTLINNALQSDDSGHRNRRYVIFGNGTLLLQQMGKRDEGDYTCYAKNKLGKDERKVSVSQDTRAFFLECPARGKPHPEFAWVLPNGTMLAPGVKLQRFTHHLGNGTLQISHPVASDKGVYRCLAKNVAGQAEKRYALEAGRKPLIRGTPGGMKITYGLNLNLPCMVDGWQQATITWTLPNGLVLDKPQTIGRVSFLTNGTLQLRHVATFDRGTYTCKAFNYFGSSTLSYPVAVMVFPPRVTNTLTSITRVNRGSPVKLNCVASGIPKPDISWTLPGRTTLAPHNRFAVQGGIYMTEEGSLVIQNPMLMHSGIYKCNAKNALGTDFKSTYLHVV